MPSARPSKLSMCNFNQHHRVKYGAKDGGCQRRGFNGPTLHNKSKKPSVTEVKVHVWLLISHSQTCIASQKKLEIIMAKCASSAVRRISINVPFVDSICILCPTETKQKGGPASSTITMIIFCFWHLQMQVFQKPKLKTGITPQMLRRDKMQGL